MRMLREVQLRADLAGAYAALRESLESVTQRLREEGDCPLRVAEDLASAEAEQGAARQRVIRILGNP
jgi:hypothetical protein